MRSPVKIIVTGSNCHHGQRQADAYLLKPVKSPELLSVIEEILKLTETMQFCIQKHTRTHSKQPQEFWKTKKRYQTPLRI